MRITSIYIQNFRKLYQCKIDIADTTTVFVGANNSGKTSAMYAIGKFLGKRRFLFNDFTITNHKRIDGIGSVWTDPNGQKPKDISGWLPILPSMDIWLDVEESNFQHIAPIIPTLDWDGGKLGVRIVYQPDSDKLEDLYNRYTTEFFDARELERHKPEGSTIALPPGSLSDFLAHDDNLGKYFTLQTYILDPTKADNTEIQETDLGMACSDMNPLSKIIKVDYIDAERGLFDSEKKDGGVVGDGKLSTQLQSYYSKHLDPDINPTEEDLVLLDSARHAKEIVDKRLDKTLRPAVIAKLEKLGYPGVTDPRIVVESRIDTNNLLRHESAVQYELGPESEKMRLPEMYNGLGYQNLFLIFLWLVAFRAEWLHESKNASGSEAIEPLHLVLIEEPEAHLHVQVQQIFIRKAYEILSDAIPMYPNGSLATQMIVSTHSSHIAKETDFSCLRYFKRMLPTASVSIPISKVANMSTVLGDKDETSRFATRYIQTTHCDLFFADAIIIIEGAAERMLLPHFIRCNYEKLNCRYISILPINGRHMQRLKELLDKLALPTLVITDIDTAESSGHHVASVPKRESGLISGNPAITNWFFNGENSYDALLAKNQGEKIFQRTEIPDNCTCNYKMCLAYQIPVKETDGNATSEFLPRTFEDSFIYTNKDKFLNLSSDNSNERLLAIKSILGANDRIDKKIFDKLNEPGFKAGFALDIIYDMDINLLKVPNYIDEGLRWIENELMGNI